MTHCPGEASLNPHSNSGKPHQVESWPKRTVAPEERSNGYSRERPRRHRLWEKEPRRAGRKQHPKQTRMTGHDSAIRHRNGSTSHNRQDANDKWVDGLYGERP